MRNLEQIDLALTAVETKLPQIYNGLMTTMRQNNLTLEGGMNTLAEAVGQPAEDPNPATGIRGDIAALTTLVMALRTDVDAIKLQLGI